MKAPKPEELVSYLYDEADDATRQAVEQCEESRAQVEEWRATMARLDQWKIEEPAVPKPTLGQRLSPALKIAAVIAVLLGSGLWISQQMRGGSEELVASAPPESTLPAAELAPAPVIQVEQVEKHILMASAAMTHRQVQAHLQEALKHLESNEMRNETLAVFLPPQEQVAYQERAEALQEVAEGVARETTRREDFTKQIIARAEARAARRH